MVAGRRKAVALWVRARDLALNVLIMGGGEVLLALVVWPLLFRKYPQGFSMALSLVGFSVWAIAFVTSLGRHGSPMVRGSASDGESDSFSESPLSVRLPQRFQLGCGLPFFLSSFIPLTLAFILRVRADLQAGYTWNDLFPTLR